MSNPEIQDRHRGEKFRTAFVFFTANALVLSLISIRYSSFVETDGLFPFLYLLASSIGHFFLLSMLCCVIFIFPLIYFIPGKKVLPMINVTVGSIVVAALVLDTYIFGFYRFHLNLFTLSLIFGGAYRDIFQFHEVLYIIAIIFISIVIFFEYFLFKLAHRISRRISRAKILALTITPILLYLLSNFAYAVSDAIYYTPILKTYKCYPLHYPLTMRKILNRVIDTKLDEFSTDIASIDRGVIRYPKAEIKTKAKGLNIIYIVLDTWDYRCMDSLITPNIFAFSKKCQVFTNHISGGNGTREGIFTLFYGIPAIYWDDFKANKVGAVFIDALLEHNYDIRAFPSSTLISPAFDKTVFASVPDLDTRTPGEFSRDRDKNLTENFLRFTDDRKDSSHPFFAFLFYDSMHSLDRPEGYYDPFKPTWPWPMYHLFSNDLDPTEYYNLYRNSAHYVDELVGEVIRQIEKHHLLENTIVLITGDHGQEFNDLKKNYWGHNGNFSFYQIGVPMMMFLPGHEPGINTYRTTHFDIAPTVLKEAFDIGNEPGDYTMGKSLFDSTSYEYFMVGSKWKFGILEEDRITTVDYNGTYSLTDLSLNPLPHEKLNSKLISKAILEANQFYKPKKTSRSFLNPGQ